MSRLTLPLAVEWKAGSDAGALEGYASVFGNVDEVGDVVRPGAFRRTIDHWRKASQPMPLIADHVLSTDGLIGSITDLGEDSRGLRFKARFSRSEKAQRIRQDILDGNLRGTSFTYEVKRDSPGRGSIAGKAIRRFLDELRVFEITISPFPINDLAGVTAAKATTASWDGSAGRFTPEQWRSSTLIDTGVGETDSKERYKLPVREPGGELNVNAVHAAAGALAGGRGGVSAPADQQRSAARKLVRLYGEIDEDPPDSLRRLAGMGSSSFTDWLESMEHAIGIKDPFARKAAVDQLVDSYERDDPTDPAPGPGDAPATADVATDDGDGSTPDDAYAVSFLAQSSDGTTSTTGDPHDALPGPLADLEQQRATEQIDALEVDITAALEG